MRDPLINPYRDGFRQYSSDVLEFARCLKGYLESGPRVTLYPAVVGRAARLLGVMARVDERTGRVYWYLGNWKRKLRAAGVEPDSMRVVDVERWRAAWQQLVELRGFRESRQAEYMAGEGLCEPVIVPVRKRHRKREARIAIAEWIQGRLREWREKRIKERER